MFENDIEVYDPNYDEQYELEHRTCSACGFEIVGHEENNPSCSHIRDILASCNSK